MKLRFLVPSLAALLAVSACSKEKKKGDDGTTPVEAKKGDPAQPTPGNEAPAPDVSKTNALWALAPKGTVMGAVAAPGSAASLHSMMMGIIATAEARPMGAKLLREMREEAKDGPINPLDAASIASAGIDLGGSAAVFMVAKKQGYMVLPVTDREAFRKITEGTLETIEGLEVDRLDDDLLCTSKNDLYLCSSSVAFLNDFGGKADSELAKRVAALPMEYRGQAEVVMDVASMKKLDEDFDEDFDGQLSNPQLGIAALRFGNGALTARVWFQVKALDKVAAAAAVPNTLGASLGESRPSGLVSFRMPVALMTAEMPTEGKDIAGLDLKDDVFGNLTGEFIGYAPQSEGLWGRVAFGLKDSKPFTTLLNMGCGMAPMAGIPGITVTPGDGTCEALIDVSKLPLPDPTLASMFSEPVSIKAAVKADRFEITLGKEAPLTKNPVSALGQELMAKKWSFAMWSEGMGIASGPEIPWDKMPAGVSGDILEGVQMAIWTLAQVYEVGMAGAVRDDGLHGVFHIATYAGDPPEAYKAYNAAVTKVLASGSATAEFAAIKEKWPNTMAGRGGTGSGSMMIAGVTGVLAAVAIPAFMKYQQRSIEAGQKYEEMAIEREKEYQEALESK